MPVPGGAGREPFSLRRRLQWLVVALVALIVGAGAAALLIIDARDDALDVILFRLGPAEAATLRLGSALVDQQASVRGFVLIQREDVLEPFQRAVARETSALEELDIFLEGTGLEARVPRVRAAIEQWRREIVEPEISAIRAGREAEARALAATGEEAFTAARAEVRGLSVSVVDQLRLQQASFAGARRAITQVVAVNVIVAIMLLVAVTYLLRRWVTDPLVKLRQQVEVVSGGQLGQAIRPEGPMELADLGADVEAMRVRILQEVDEVRRAEEGLAQRAPAVVSLRDALSPRTHDLPDGFQLAVHFEPAEGILAGDWYEALALPGNRIGFCMGDVAGHGASSAIVALRARDLAVAALRLDQSPSEALALIADLLNAEHDEIFVTCFTAVFEPDGRICYANGGHPPPLLASAASRYELTALGPTGPLLGPLPGKWTTVDLPAEANSTLVVYTDGVIESKNSQGEEYGSDRFARVVTGARDRGADGIIAAFVADFRSFDAGRSRDDVTVVALTQPSRRSGD